MSVPATRQVAPSPSLDDLGTAPADGLTAPPGASSAVARGGATYRWSFISLFVRVVLQAVSGVVIAREIGPSHYGTGTLIMSIYVVLSGFIQAGANGTMIIRRHLGRSLMLRILAVDAAFGVLGAGGLAATALFQHGDTRTGFLVASVGCLITAISGPGYALTSRALRFRRISAGEILGALVGTSVAITVSATTHSLVALPLQYVLIDAGICLVVARSLFARPAPLGVATASTEVGLRYGLQLGGNQLASVGARNADNYLVAGFLGQAALGQYVLAYRLMMLPIQNIAMVLTRVLVPRLRHLAGAARSSTEEVRSLLLAIALPVGAITGAGLPFARYVLLGVLGHRYEGAVGPTEVLLLASFPQCCTNVTSSVLASTGHGRIQLRLTSLGLVFAVLAVVIGHPWGIVGVTIVYLVLTVVLAVTGVTVLHRMRLASPGPYLESGRFFVVLAGACAALAALARTVSPDPGLLPAFGEAALVAVVGVGVTALVLRRSTRRSFAFWGSVARGGELPAPEPAPRRGARSRRPPATAAALAPPPTPDVPSRRRPHPAPGVARSNGGSMSLQELWQGLKRSLVTVITFLVIGIALAVAYLAITPKSYTASTRVFVTASSDTGTLTQNSEGIDLVRNSMGSYAALVGSPAVLASAAKALGVSESDLQAKVTATNPLNTSLLDISVRDGSAARAKTYADAVSTASVSAIEALQSSAGDAGHSPVRLTVVDPATEPTSPTTPNRSLDLVLGALVGLGLGIAVAGGRGKFVTPAPAGPDREARRVAPPADPVGATHEEPEQVVDEIPSEPVPAEPAPDVPAEPVHDAGAPPVSDEPAELGTDLAGAEREPYSTAGELEPPLVPHDEDVPDMPADRAEDEPYGAPYHQPLAGLAEIDTDLHAAPAPYASDDPHERPAGFTDVFAARPDDSAPDLRRLEARRWLTAESDDALFGESGGEPHPAAGDAADRLPYFDRSAAEHGDQRDPAAADRYDDGRRRDADDGPYDR